jgi:hypothetical protein
LKVDSFCSATIKKVDQPERVNLQKTVEKSALTFSEIGPGFTGK